MEGRCRRFNWTNDTPLISIKPVCAAMLKPGNGKLGPHLRRYVDGAVLRDFDKLRCGQKEIVYGLLWIVVGSPDLLCLELAGLPEVLQGTV
jgi:hypothetical protein